MSPFAYRKALTTLGATALLVTMASPSPAYQIDGPATGSLIPHKAKTLKGLSAGLLHQEVGACVYQRSRNLADQVLSHSDAFSFDTAKFGTSTHALGLRLLLDRCLGEAWSVVDVTSQMRIDFTTLRGSLEEQAYLQRNSAPPKALPEAKSRIYLSKDDKLAFAQSLGEFADCIVAKNAAGADAVLRTVPETPQERAAAVALAPVLGSCLGKGQTLALTPMNIRMYVADGLWQRFVGPTA